MASVASAPDTPGVGISSWQVTYKAFSLRSTESVGQKLSLWPQWKPETMLVLVAPDDDLLGRVAL